MGYKTIIVHVEHGGGSESRLRTSAALAKRLGAGLIGLGAVQYATVPDTAYGLTSAEVLQALLEQIQGQLKEAESDFHACVVAEGLDALWRSSLDFPAAAMAAEARGADLAIVGSSGGRDLRAAVDGGDLVMRAGIPVLVLPVATDNVQTRTVFVAWKNTRETRRAVGDALPFLKEANRVVVASIQEEDATDRLQAELEDVAERLRRHDVPVETVLAPRLDLDVPDQLLAMVESQKADLVVAGAYGHSRLQQWIFGGVTRRLMHGAPVPVLFSR